MVAFRGVETNAGGDAAHVVWLRRTLVEIQRNMLRTPIEGGFDGADLFHSG